jgi:hypothetical protein
LEPDAVPQALVRTVHVSLDDRDALDGLLEPRTGAELERLLGRLEDYDGKFETEQPEHLIGALLDRSDRLRRAARGSAIQAPRWLARALVRALHGREPDAVERAARAVHSDSLWDRYELILTIGHVEHAPVWLVSEKAATELERKLTADVLLATAEQLADERGPVGARRIRRGRAGLTGPRDRAHGPAAQALRPHRPPHSPTNTPAT